MVNGPELLVPSLLDEVEVELADGREESVRVVQQRRHAAVRCLDAVVRDCLAGHYGNPDAVLLMDCLDTRRGGDDHDLVCQRAHRRMVTLPEPAVGPSTECGS
jgi:hypothetical protein